MKAELIRQGDITIVSLKGHLDFETAEPFRRDYLERLKSEKVVFNFEGLNFVGSSGITMFFDLLGDFAKRVSVKPKFCGLGSEFKKIFSVSQLSELEIFENSSTAVTAFTAPVTPLPASDALAGMEVPWEDKA